MVPFDAWQGSGPPVRDELQAPHADGQRPAPERAGLLLGIPEAGEVRPVEDPGSCEPREPVQATGQGQDKRVQGGRYVPHGAGLAAMVGGVCLAHVRSAFIASTSTRGQCWQGREGAKRKTPRTARGTVHREGQHGCARSDAPDCRARQHPMSHST